MAHAAIQAAIRDNWIKPTAALSSHLLGVLLAQLHRGEAEAIALAADLPADILLIDEQEGRQLAAHSGLTDNRRARHSLACEEDRPHIFANG